MSQSKPNNSAMILVLLGVISYIVVDSGIINWSPKGMFSSSADSPQDLAKFSNQLKTELLDLEKDVTAGRKQLEVMTSNSKKLESKIRDQKKTLALLDSEVAQLEKLKENIQAAQSDLRDKEVRRDVASSLLGAVARGLPVSNWVDKPQSAIELAERVSDLTGTPTSIEAIKRRSKEFLRVQTRLKFSNDSSYFLTSSGLRQVALLSEGAFHLGYKRIHLAYKDQDALTNDRVNAIRQYLKSTYGDSLRVSRLNVGSQSPLNADLEIWAAR